jgi:O-antigen/teichoic acid export membrane protein
MAFTTGDTFLGVSITPDWILVYVLCVLEALLGVLGSLIRASGSAREFAVHRTVGIIRIAVMAGLVAWLDDPFYYLLGGIWTAAIYLVPFVRKGLAHAKLAENRRSFLSATKALLVFGWPFVPVMLSLRLLAFSDRLFLQHYHSLDEVGRYTLGYVLGSSLGFFYAVVGADFEPSLYTHTSGSEQKGRMLLERYIESLCIIGLVAAAALCSILYVLDTHLGVEKLRNVGGIVTPVLAAHIINVVYLKSHFLLTLRKLPRSIAVVTVGSGIAIVVANFLLIPPLGGRGAALATLVGFAVLALFLHLRSLQEWRFMPFDHFVTGFVIALSCIATLAGESLLTAATLYFVCAVGLTSYSVTREGGTVMVAFSSLAQKIPVPLRLRR